MAIYAVHCPALDRDPQAAFEQARTVKQGFAFAGLVFGPLWLLFHGLWLAVAGWILAAVVVWLGVTFGLLSLLSAVALYILSAAFIGVQGRMLQSSALARQGRPLADIVTARARVDAEHGFLARALVEQPSPPSAPRPIVAAPASRGDSSIIGLFPEAGTK